MYGMVWYVGSLVGYCIMQLYNQGLSLKTSQEMFFYTAGETLFMVSMAMSYFFSYQTFAIDGYKPGGEVRPSEAVVGV